MAAWHANNFNISQRFVHHIDSSQDPTCLIHSKRKIYNVHRLQDANFDPPGDVIIWGREKNPTPCHQDLGLMSPVRPQATRHEVWQKGCSSWRPAGPRAELWIQERVSHRLIINPIGPTHIPMISKLVWKHSLFGFFPKNDISYLRADM